MNGARLPSAEALRREVATLVFTPDRLAVVKGGPADSPRVLRPRARAAPSGAGRSAPGVSRSARAAQCCAAARAARPLRTERARAVDGAGGRPGRRAGRPAARRRSPALADGFGAVRRTSSGFPRRHFGTRASHRRASSSSSGSTATSSAARRGSGPHLHDVVVASGDPRPAAVRLAGRAASRRARACCSPKPKLLSPPPLLLLDDVLSELDPGRRRDPRRPARRPRADGDHRDACECAAGDAGAGRGGGAWNGSLTKCGRSSAASALRPGWPSWSSAGLAPSGPRSRASPGRRGSPATARSTSRPPTRSGRSSSGNVRRRSATGSAARASGSRRGRSRSPSGRAGLRCGLADRGGGTRRG